MPLNAIGWTTEEDVLLADLVQPHPCLYNVQDPSRKNILAREQTWVSIAKVVEKPIEECKKRWRGLRDGYMRSKRMGSVHKTKTEISKKLSFLDEVPMDGSDAREGVEGQFLDEADTSEEAIVGPEQVITDNQEYYEITVVDGPQVQLQPQLKPLIKILPKAHNAEDAGTKIIHKNRGRKRAIPMPRNIPPIKILPKPVLVNGPKMMNGPKIVHYIEDPKTPEQRSQTIDKIIEKVLKENTNEIDVFFRSMAASVKKLQPHLIPKVKMEVCNIIAKYEMQSFDKVYNG